MRVSGLAGTTTFEAVCATCDLLFDTSKTLPNAGKLTAAKQAAGWEPRWRSGW